jgi:hypothetical protein
MQSKGKWPFADGERELAKVKLDHITEQEHARLAAETFHRQHMRFDRLIVGGRARTKKQGLR